jgi:hypothetical protein
MFSKRPLPQRNDLHPSKRLRANVEDLFMSSEVSGQRAQTVFEDASYHDPHCEEYAKAGARGSQPGNIARDLRRKMPKHKKNWMPPYMARIKVWNPKQKRLQRVDCAITLPHELVYSLLIFNDAETLCSAEGLAYTSKQHLDMCKVKLGTDLVVPLSLWGDGVPCNWDRTESLECVTIAVPGLSQNCRLPLFGISKKFMIQHQTWDDVFAILSWSFQVLATGIFPDKRHDGLDWNSSDSRRSRMGAKPIGVQGVLVEVKADWQFLAHTFRFPAHNKNSGCCWLCKVTPSTMRDFSLTASWRTERLSHWDLLARWHAENIPVSTIFRTPFLQSGCFVLDWLHAVDQGVGADFLGNCFYYCLDKMPGQNQVQRTDSLFRLIQSFYTRNGTEDQLQDLTLLMIKQQKGAKLRSQAAKARALIPFALELCMDVLEENDPFENTMQQAALHLEKAYRNLAVATFNADHFQLHVRKFLLLWLALEAGSPDPTLWRTKPKFHLLAELSLTKNCPSQQWVYRDEDFGGTAAKLSRRRGGKNSVLSTSRNLLLKFYCNNKVPVL